MDQDGSARAGVRVKIRFGGRSELRPPLYSGGRNSFSLHLPTFTHLKREFRREGKVLKPNWIGRGAVVARGLRHIAQAFRIVLLVLSDMADSSSRRVQREAAIKAAQPPKLAGAVEFCNLCWLALGLRWAYVGNTAAKTGRRCRMLQFVLA